MRNLPFPPASPPRIPLPPPPHISISPLPALPIGEDEDYEVLFPFCCCRMPWVIQK